MIATNQTTAQSAAIHAGHTKMETPMRAAISPAWHFNSFVIVIYSSYSLSLSLYWGEFFFPLDYFIR